MKKVFIGIMILLFLLSFLWMGNYFYTKMKSDPTVYETIQPKKEKIIKKTVATGAIEPKQEITIKPRVSGIVSEIKVVPGETVAVGQEIAKIKLVPDAQSINSAESQLELAKIDLQRAKKELKRQQEIYGGGQDVEQATIQLNEAEKELKRQENLYKEGVISEQSFNSFKADRDMKRNQLDNAKSSADRNLAQFEVDVQIKKNQLETAQNSLKLLREGATKKTAASNVIISTVAGMVLDVPVKVGSSVIETNNFNEGTTIASVADMQSMIFKGKVDESEVGKVREGMDLNLTIGAIEDKTYPAKLTYIAPKGKMDEGAIKFEIEAEIDLSSGDFLRAGYSANADIVLDKRESALTIEEKVIQFENDTLAFVEVQTGDNQFEKRYIKTGISDGLKIEILDGLALEEDVKVPQ